MNWNCPGSSVFPGNWVELRAPHDVHAVFAEMVRDRRQLMHARKFRDKLARELRARLDKLHESVLSGKPLNIVDADGSTRTGSVVVTRLPIAVWDTFLDTFQGFVEKLRRSKKLSREETRKRDLLHNFEPIIVAASKNLAQFPESSQGGQ